jgi:large subunit ribosomal protein L3
MMGLIGKKIGMTRIFSDDGTSSPVTVVDISENTISQVKTFENDGYSAIQVAYGSKSKRNISKAIKTHLHKAKLESCLFMKEFRVNKSDEGNFSVGQSLKVDVFQEGQFIDVQAVTKGKGFAGAIKRHNFSSQRATHGNSLSHNSAGSTGMNQDPGRVFKGKKMAGHLGDVRVTVQNLKVVDLDIEKGLLIVSGNVPGAKGGYIYVKDAVKKSASN